MTGANARDAPGDDWRRRRSGLPRTHTAGPEAPGPAVRVFDPALKHFADGYRITDSAVDEAVRPAWRAVRRTALDVVARGGTERPGANRRAGPRSCAAGVRSARRGPRRP
ncbi:hypothetical protein ACWGIU_04855 [Streptomyces sp. NPDC054840]